MTSTSFGGSASRWPSGGSWGSNGAGTGATSLRAGRIAGLRTFALAGLLGGVSGWLASLTGPGVLAFASLGLSGLLALSYWVRLKEDEDLGLTTEVALLLTFALGAASVLGDLAPPAAVAVVAALLLSMKHRLHRWVARIERLELEALLKLALISVVILPLLPDQGYGPGAALNPYEIWWAVVVVRVCPFSATPRSGLAAQIWVSC